MTKVIVENYCNFRGRAARSEYWWFAFFNFILNLVISLSGNAQIIGAIITLVLLLPCLGVAVRRLHDTGRSGFWLLIGFIPLLGLIILLVWMIQDSEPEENQYGPVPNVD